MGQSEYVILLIVTILYSHWMTVNCDNLVIPNIVHMIKLDDRPLTQYTFLGILTIFSKIKPKILFLHSIYEPHGHFWSLLVSEYADRLFIMKINEPISIFSHLPKAKDYAHKSDIVRMNILKQMGGIYIDTDIIILKSFDDLRANQSISLGLQTDKNFCNGVIIAHRTSKFLSKWYDGYKSADFDKCWDCHSVVYPSQLKKNMTNEVNTLPIESFYDPSFGRHDIRELYNENIKKKARVRPPYEGKYGQHLWYTSPLAAKFLKAHTLTDICNSTSIYNEMLRFALNDTMFLRKTCQF